MRKREAKQDGPFGELGSLASGVWSIRQRGGVKGQVPQSRRRARTQWWRSLRSLGKPRWARLPDRACLPAFASGAPLHLDLP